jgi:hypothetical protein
LELGGKERMIDLENLERENRERCERLLQKSEDLEDRLQITNLYLSYDQATDILYVSFGAFGSVIMQEVAAGYWLRLDLKSDQIVGVELMDAKQRLSTYPALAQLVQRMGLLLGDEGLLRAFGAELRRLLAANASSVEAA